MPSSDNTPTPVEIPHGYPHQTGPVPHAYAQPDSTVNISRVVLSAPMVGALLLVLLSGVASVALVGFQGQVHQADKAIHLNADQVTAGGGVAYRQEIAASYAKTRRLLKAMQITCRKQGDGLACRIDLPEGE